MSTNWTFPTVVTQYAEDESHIAWKEENFDNITSPSGRMVTTNGNLMHIARSPRNDITMKTFFLRASGFNFQNLPENISGITCRLTMKRGGRIVDDTVQLCYQENLIGENRAGKTIDPIQVYGTPQDLWNTNLDVSMVQDLSFGIVLRFRSHPSWPHKTAASIDTVELQIH